MYPCKIGHALYHYLFASHATSKPHIMRCIQWIWILLLLCNTACNGCKQYEIPYAEDPWGASIAIKPTSSGGATLLGSINGLPALSLHGTISKNVPGVGTAYLCALFVPDGKAPDAGAKAIQGHTVKSDSHSTSSGTFALGKLYKLPNDSFVQYTRPLGPDETGDVDFTVAAYDADDSLVLGTAYNIYLGIKVGPHFFYTAGAHANYIHPNNALALTQVTMAGARCVQDRDTNGKILPRLFAHATATDPPNNATTGFLCIKRGANLTPVGVFSKQLAPGNMPLPTTSNTLTAHPDSTAVCCAVGPAATTYSIDDLQDTNNALELGATYDVYGYIVDGHDYYVSQNSYPITLPEVEIKVTMGTMGDPKLIAMKQSPTDTVYNVSEFQLELSAHIDKIDNAEDPIAGFVFVAVDQAQDKTAICQTIKGTISSTGAPGDVIDVGGNKGHVVCIAATTIAAMQAIKYTCNLQNGTSSYLDLTKDYHIYFWVKDTQGDGELFLSDNHQVLNVLYVDGDGITNVVPSHSGNALTIRPHVDIPTLRNADEARIGVIFSATRVTPTDLELQSLRDRYGALVGRSGSSNLQIGWNVLDPDTNKFYLFPNASIGNTLIGAHNNSHLAPEALYLLNLVVLRRQALYCIPCTSDYETPAYLGSTQSNPVMKLQDGNEIELDMSQNKAYWIHAKGKSFLNPTQGARVSKRIKEAIDCYYSEEEERKKAYKKFRLSP